jgi:TIR domain
VPGIFISYRNADRSYGPVLIDRELRRRFGPDNVFQATRSNLPGTPFPQEIMRWLRECTLFIPLIDPPWVGEDLHRLHDKKDWVRREIRYALDHGKLILPVLLDGASMPKSGELPEDIAPVTRRVALPMRALTADADLLRLVGEVERLVPDLVLAALTDLPLPEPEPGHEAALLRAEYEVVTFRPPRQFDQLAQWCADRTAPPVRLVTGPGGVGKTRLGLRLCAQLRGMGWSAGLLSSSAPESALGRLGQIGTPCLVVIDDAGTRPEQVRVALRSLATTRGSPSRLLLLARSGGDWLDQLREDPDDRVAALVDGIDPSRLTPVHGDFKSVCAEFARRLKRPVPPPPAELPAPAATMLELQAAALVHLMPSSDPARPPLQRILELERNYWRQAAATFGLASLSRRNLAEIMTAVTLFGASTEPEANALIASLRAFQGAPLGTIDACRDLLGTVLPGPAPLNPLQPEQLGEDAVAEFLRSGASLSSSVPVVTDQQARQALITLGRCLSRHPDAGDGVAAFLAQQPLRLLSLATTALAAVPQPELLAEPMLQSLDRVPEADLDALVTALPQRSGPLASFAVAVTERALTSARQVRADDLTTARLSRLLATRLAYLEERAADAAEAARAAVAQLTALADTSAETSAELAEAHAALALALDMDPAAGPAARDAGAAAIKAYRALSTADRRDAGLATALNNQSIRLKRAGQNGSALALAVEASELTGRLNEKRPAGFRSLHADVEDTLSTLRELNDQPAEAERAGREALALRRTLAEARPDAYRPQLAGTLFNLGQILSRHGGNPVEVRALWAESFAVFDDLAARQPGRFDEQRTRVHRYLSNLGPAGDD